MVEELIDLMRFEFVTKVYPQLTLKGRVYCDLPTHFDDHWKVVFARWQEKTAKTSSTLKMKTFAESKKAKKVQGGGKEPAGGAPSRSQTHGAG